MQTTVEKPFQFKQFSIEQDRCTMKVGTDGVLLGAWADVAKTVAILDIGAGAGLIAIMLAQRSAATDIHAVEIDEEACQQAADNMANSPWPDRLKAIHTPIQDYVKTSRFRYDLIVSNPPFFTGGTFSSSQDKNSVRHTIKLPHGDLLYAVRKLLNEDGKFCTILPYIEGLRFKELAGKYHLYCSKITEVRPKPSKPVERLLLQFESTEHPLEKDGLVIGHENGKDWTAGFMELTKGFYLKI